MLLLQFTWSCMAHADIVEQASKEDIQESYDRGLPGAHAAT